MEPKRKDRRAFLTHAGAAALGLVVAPVAVHSATRPAAPCFAAAWDDTRNRHFVGLLEDTDRSLRVRHQLELPTRAHGLVVEADGGVLAVARRPGDWMLRWRPGSAAEPQWRWGAADRRFCGHVLQAPDGALFTTEIDLADDQGLLVRRDPASLEVVDEWRTQGIDPHAVLRDADGSLLVANGGVPTRPESGRAKLSRERMDPSLVRLHARTGALLGQWRLDDARLSIRHLARHANGTVGISLQAEHDDAATRAAAPLLALFDGRALRTVAQPEALAGYGGDITATSSGFMVAATRAGRLVRWDSSGSWEGAQALAEACPLAWTARGELWAGGSQAALQRADRPDAQPHTVGALRLDNHWASWNQR